MCAPKVKFRPFMAPLAAFKKTRHRRWTAENRPFNPKEPWRIRPRALYSTAIPGFWATPAPFLCLARGAVLGLVSPLKSRWLFSYPSVTRAEGSALPLACGPAGLFTRVGPWLRLIRHAVGRLTVLKMRYKGKSFRWHRRKRSLVLRFGHSHLVFCRPLPWVKWRKHGRMKLIFWGTNAWYLHRFLKLTTQWRPMNIYHGRGLRLAKQAVLRKSGKVSAYR